MKALSEVAKDALELRPDQRLTLARILLELDGADEEFSPEAESAWEEEICRRLQAVKLGQAQSRSYEEVFADLDRGFSS